MEIQIQTEGDKKSERYVFSTFEDVESQKL